MLKIRDLFDLRHTLAREYLEGYDYPWEALPGIRELVLTLGTGLGEEYERFRENIWVHETAVVAPSASINGPCIIGPDTQVRHGAFIRGSALVGGNCVVGNSTEIKNAILFDGVQVPHYNYIGDSILGFKVHLGAGAITSNIKSDKGKVFIHAPWGNIPTLLRKMGAMVGDHTEVGCGSVLNPGTIVGRNATIYPLSNVRGCIPADSIYKSGGVVIEKR